MTGDAVGLPGFTEGDGVGEGEGSGAGADDEGADDGMAEGVTDDWLRFFLSEAKKTYANAPPQTKTTTNAASSHLLLFHFHASLRALPPGSWPYLKSEGFNTTIL